MHGGELGGMEKATTEKVKAGKFCGESCDLRGLCPCCVLFEFGVMNCEERSVVGAIVKRRNQTKTRKTENTSLVPLILSQVSSNFGVYHPYAVK